MATGLPSYFMPFGTSIMAWDKSAEALHWHVLLVMSGGLGEGGGVLPVLGDEQCVA